MLNGRRALNTIIFDCLGPPRLETAKLINSNKKLDDFFFDIEYAKGSIFSCIKQLKH